MDILKLFFPKIKLVIYNMITLLIGYNNPQLITVIGKDNVGILHKVSGVCSEKGVNVIEVTQSVLQDMFAMIMMVDVSACDIPFTQLVDEMVELGNENGLVIHCMHEDIFNAMHTI